MIRSFRCPGVVVVAALVTACLQPLSAQEPCSDTRPYTDRLAATLTKSAAPAAISKGVFSVKRTNGAVQAPLGINTNPVKFEITYAVAGKTVAMASVAKGSQLWSEDWYLELEAGRDRLNVNWSSGGSGCCLCEYIITATPSRFVVSDTATSPTYKAETPAARYIEQVEVERVLVDVRVLDSDGLPVTGLGADDFSVKIGGRSVPIESTIWVGGARSGGGSVTTETVEHGRLIMFLFQKDLEPSRLTGLMRMLVESQSFIDDLTPRDRVAVLSFDSQLKIWLDFTNDRDAIRQVLRRSILFDDPQPVLPAPDLSLVSRLDPATALKTHTIEKSLHRIADAVRGLPGSKSVVFIGHGFGRLGWTGVAMEHGYEDARDALMAARTSVFSLDVTNADYHSLEAGLQLVSRETGGFFARTHLFTEQAMNRLSSVLAGYYVLFLEQPNVRPGTHDVDVRLTRRQGTVLARDSYVRQK